MEFLIINILFISLLIFLYFKISKFKKLFKFCITIWTLLLVLELTIFNFRFYLSLFNYEFTSNEYRVGNGIKINNDGSFTVVDDKENFFEFNNLYQHLDNIYIDLDLIESPTNEKTKAVNVSFGYTDAANRKYSYTQDRLMLAGPGKGEITKLHLTGKTKRLKLYISANEKYSFKLKDVVFNKCESFDVSVLRMSIIFMIIIIAYIFRPKSSIYRINIMDKVSRKYIIAAFIFQIVLFTGIIFLNTYFIKEDFKKDAPQRDQYKMLAEAFLSGQTYLKEEPSELLKSLKSPYDTNDRKSVFSGTEEKYLWDVAYYNQKYFVYFGVCPVLMYYLPYYVLTGTHIKTSVCIYITMFITLIGIFILLRKIIVKWFKNTSLGMYLLLTFMFVNGCGLMSIMGRPDHYSLPILMGIMFSIYGLISWIKASENYKKRYFFFGSMCMAAIAACRPQLLLTSLFAIPLFKDYFINKDIFKKDKLSKLIAFILPYIVIGILVMLYNYVRFDSPFDFGANYNLTTNDMTKRGFVLDRIPLGIFYYLFNAPVINLLFPFVHRSIVANNYMGLTIFENMPAGVLFTNLLCIFGLVIFRYRKEFKDNEIAYKLGVVSLISSIALIVADTEMAGILPRYICDFGYLLYFATIISLLPKVSKIEKNKFWHKIMLSIIIFMFVYNFFFLFSDSNLINSSNYYYFRNLFEFWI